jgi:3-oxoadipate enol-lactonase
VLDSLNLLPGRFRIVRYDIRGYGRSPAPVAAFTQLADLIAVLDYLDVAQAALVAHSGGGGPAIGLALAQPARVGPLILAAPGIRDYPWPPEDPYGAEFGRLFNAGDRDGLVALGLQTWAAAGADPSAQAQVRGAVAAFSARGSSSAPTRPLIRGSAGSGLPQCSRSESWTMRWCGTPQLTSRAAFPAAVGL